MNWYQNLPTNLPIIFFRSLETKEPFTFQHESYDFIYVVSGKLTISCQEQEAQYFISDICLINPMNKGTLTPKENCSIFHLGIHPYFIEQCLGNYGTLICDSVLEPGNNYTALKEIVINIGTRYLEGPSENHLSILSLLFELMDHLKKDNYFKPVLYENITEKHGVRINKIIDYIDHHYNEPLTLTALSEALYLTPQYLSKFFHKYLHQNFKTYLMEKRLFHAYRDVSYTDDPITEIAIRNGFSDVTAFGRAFRASYQMTPSQFRKNKNVHMLAEEYNQLDQYSNAIQVAENSCLYSNQVDVTVNETEGIRSNYSTLLNVSSAKNLLSENYRRLLLESRKSLGFRYLRIQGILSSSFIPRVLPDYNYYFLDLDDIMHFMQDHDLIPFIDLTRLSHAFYEPGATFQDSLSSLKNNRFFELLQAFLVFSSQNYPKEWTSQWTFELWKLPRESPNQYANDFKLIQEMIKGYLPDASLGGPGFDSRESLKDLDEILKLLYKADRKPSFISAHLSLMKQPETSKAIISMDQNLPLNLAQKIKKMIHKYDKHTPFYITEWNSISLTELPIQYSCYQSAYICKTCLDLNSISDLMGYWLFSDTSTQSSPLKQKAFYFWGSGLFNKDNIAMPAFYAFQMLERLGTVIIKRGENFCITRKGPDHYQIMCFNYAHPRSSCLYENRKYSSFSNVYKIFEEVPAVNFRFLLHGITPGKYRISRFLLDRSHGSILDIWIGGFVRSNISETEYLMDIKLPSASQLNYLLKACIPEERNIYSYAEDYLEVETSILAHNVCVWDIIRQV